MLGLAHRGASAYAPENTEPAFRKAIELGADGVELDVHLCKDGHMVVNHNFDVDHNSDGLGLIEEYTLRELKQLDFGLWKGVEFKGTSILTLEEALEIVKNMKLINIEIKSAQTPYPGLTEKVCGLVRKMALTQKVILSSFNHRVALECHNSGLPAGLLYDKPIFNPARYAHRQGVQAIHPHSALLSKNQVRIAKELGIQVNVWTVDKPKRALTLQGWGCDAVITNTPDVILKALGR